MVWLDSNSICHGIALSGEAKIAYIRGVLTVNAGYWDISDRSGGGREHKRHQKDGRNATEVLHANRQVQRRDELMLLCILTSISTSTYAALREVVLDGDKRAACRRNVKGAESPNRPCIPLDGSLPEQEALQLRIAVSC